MYLLAGIGRAQLVYLVQYTRYSMDVWMYGWNDGMNGCIPENGVPNP